MEQLFKSLSKQVKIMNNLRGIWTELDDFNLL